MTTASAMADAVSVTSPNHARTYAYGAVAWRQLYLERTRGELAARILGSRHPIEFKKGAICRIDVEDIPPTGPGKLRWLLPPKILLALKK